jgi:hypothetical protein
MPGAIWKLENQSEEASTHQGDQFGFDVAKGLVEAVGGLLQVGPGLEALALGTFLGTKTALVRVTNTGQMFICGLRFADRIDPTKSVFFDPAAVASGAERAVALPNWSGLLPLPSDGGLSGQFLKSNGAGIQPTWDVLIVAPNALLDGSVHSDTAAQVVARGALVIGNSTPKWDRLPIGAASTLLRSDGLDPSWGKVDLLSGFHGDALAAAVQAGDLIFGNATPKWARLAKGVDGQVLALVAGLPSWSAVPAPFHTDLLRVSEFTVVNCKLTSGSAVIETSGSGFSVAKIGARVVVGAQPDSGWAQLPKILSVDSDIQITVDTNWLGGTTGFTETVRVIYNDHTQYLLLDGQGSTTSLSLPQRLWGNVEWRGNRRINGSGVFLVEAGQLSSGHHGFGIKDFARGCTAFFDVLPFTASAAFLFRLPNLTTGSNGVEILVAGGTATFQNGAVAARQTVSEKDLTTNVSYQMDGTATYGVFRSAGGLDALSFNMALITALRAITWRDWSGTVPVASNVGSAGEVLTSNGAATAPSFQPAGAGSPPTFVSLSKWGTD